MDFGLKNAEGYYDLTAYEAIKNVSNEERVKPKNIIYVCSPLKGDVKKNQEKVCEYCKFVISKGHIPVAVRLMFPCFMDDTDKDERSQAMLMSLDILARCDEIWCFGDEVSEGMLKELDFAQKHMIRIKYFTKNGTVLSVKGVC